MVCADSDRGFCKVYKLRFDASSHSDLYSQESVECKPAEAPFVLQNRNFQFFLED
jgi:hypothetical protein